MQSHRFSLYFYFPVANSCIRKSFVCMSGVTSESHISDPHDSFGGDVDDHNYFSNDEPDSSPILPRALPEQERCAALQSWLQPDRSATFLNNILILGNDSFCFLINQKHRKGANCFCILFVRVPGNRASTFTKCYFLPNSHLHSGACRA